LPTTLDAKELMLQFPNRIRMVTVFFVVLATTSANADPSTVSPVEPPSPDAVDTEYRTVVRSIRPESPGTSTTVTAEDIEMTGARTVPEALALVPGLEISTSPKQGATLRLRGFDERAMLIMYDGIPLREVYDGHFDISSILASGIGTISIERGIPSLLYGANVMSGVISISSPEITKGLEAGGELNGGQIHDGKLMDIGGKARFAGRFGAFTLELDAATLHSKGYVLSDDYEQTSQNQSFHEDGDVRDGSDYAKSIVHGGASYTFANGLKLNLVANAIFMDRGMPPFEGSGYVRYWRFKYYNTYQVGLGAVYQPRSMPASWGFAGIRGHANMSFHKDDIQDYQDATYQQLTTNPLAWFVASAYDNQSFSTAAMPSFVLWKGNRLDLGIGYGIDTNRQREIPVPKDGAVTDWGPEDLYRTQTFHVAAEDNQHIGRWSIVGGLGVVGMSLMSNQLRDRSYPVNDNLMTALEARLVTDYAISDHVKVVAGMGRKTRFPTLKELFSNQVGGNPNLNAEIAWMTELGVDLTDLPIRGFSVTTRGFYNRLTDLITKQYDAYANVAQATTAGTEVEASYRIVDGLDVAANYTYLYSRDETSDRILDNRAPHTASTMLSYRSPFGLSVSGQGIFRSGEQSWYADGVTGVWKEDRLPGYFLLNGHLRYEYTVVPGCAIYATFSATNILDRDYVQGGFEPRPGRELRASIGFTYRNNLD